MLNQVLRDKIDMPEYRLLYDSQIRLTARDIRNAVSSYIKNHRKKYSSQAVDPLVAKLKQFGNEAGWLAFKVKELEKIIFDQNKGIPAVFAGKWRSIEFECIFRNQQKIDKFVSTSRANGWSKHITIKGDGSLRANDNDREGICQEVVVSYVAGNEQFVIDVCAALKKAAYVNKSCGTHVHFDMRDVEMKTVKQLGTRLARCVPALKQLLPKSRRENQYCVNNINDFETGQRYSFVNLQAYNRHKTIEVRAHSGTLDAEKILNWIAICEKIMTTRIRTSKEEIATTEDLIQSFKFDEKLAKFITDRSHKFNNATTSSPRTPEDEDSEMPY